MHISWLKLIVSVNETSCMKLIARVEQVGLTWPSTTRRANDQWCNNPKHNRITITEQALNNQLKMHGYFNKSTFDIGIDCGYSFSTIVSVTRGFGESNYMDKLV